VWLGHFVTGRWGSSTHYREEVIVLLPPYLRQTGILAGLTFSVMLPLSFSLGIAAGVREGSLADRIISLTSVVSPSVPEFASAVFLSAVFVFWLGILPGASTMISGFAWREVVLPVMVLVLYDFGYVARIDVSVQKQVLDLLERLQRQAGLTMLSITHDLRVAAQIADRIAVMQRGRLVEFGPAIRVLQTPEHPYTAELVAAAPGRSWQRATTAESEVAVP
jgi:ABC-type dipeptide/oligopeptide/nickel transport system permease component